MLGSPVGRTTCCTGWRPQSRSAGPICSLRWCSCERLARARQPEPGCGGRPAHVTRQDGQVDERLAAINERVAAATDAWLADPRDGNVYQRMVAAVEARRAYLQPPLPDQPPEPDPPVPTPSVEQDDEVLDELADAGDGAVKPVSELLAGGDARAALDRLRRSK